MGMLFTAKALAINVRLYSHDASPTLFIKNLWKPESDKCWYQNFRFGKWLSKINPPLELERWSFSWVQCAEEQQITRQPFPRTVFSILMKVRGTQRISTRMGTLSDQMKGGSFRTDRISVIRKLPIPHYSWESLTILKSSQCISKKISRP